MQLLSIVFLIAALSVGAYFQSENVKLKALLTNASADAMEAKQLRRDNEGLRQQLSDERGQVQVLSKEVADLQESLGVSRGTEMQTAAHLSHYQDVAVQKEMEVNGLNSKLMELNKARHAVPMPAPPLQPVEVKLRVCNSLEDIASASYDSKIQIGDQPVTLDDIKWVYIASHLGRLYAQSRNSSWSPAGEDDLPDSVAQAVKRKLAALHNQTPLSDWLQEYLKVRSSLLPENRSVARDGIAELEKDYQALVCLN